MEANEKKLNELEEMEAAEGTFGESESQEGLLDDEEADKTVGGGRGPYGTRDPVPYPYQRQGGKTVVR